METMTSLNIPTESKLWVYQSPNSFTLDQITLIEQELNTFVSEWASHGTALKGYFEIIENRFIVLAVDEEMQEATGCSIDKSVTIIKKIEQLLNTNLTDRGLVLFKSNNGEIDFVNFREIKQYVEKGKITPTTVIYNTSITTYNEFLNKWKIPAKDSWLNRYFT